MNKLLWLLVCVIVFLRWFAVVSGQYPDCNFTNGLGGWTNNEVLTWIQINQTVNNYGVLKGRQGDDDGYAVIDFNNTVTYRKSSEAKMYSHQITGPVCMKFFFYLHGGETGFLKILTRLASSNSEKTVFDRYGNHGHQWNFAQLYFDFKSTDLYQIVISGEVGNVSLRSSPAIDDISFANKTCEKIPQDKGYNCSFDNSRCGWTTTGSGGRWFVNFDQGLNQYTSYVRELYLWPRWWETGVIFLRSPFFPTYNRYNGCFSFQYRVETCYPLPMQKLFVFIVDGNHEFMPVWNVNFYYNQDNSWKTVEIELNFTTGFGQIVFKGMLPYCKVAFANFALYSGTGKCKSVAAEKTFFVSTKATSLGTYIISNDGALCNKYPAFYFIARVLPSTIFTKPIFIYADGYNNMWLSDQRTDTFFTLVGYFYVATNNYTDTSPLYYSMQSYDGRSSYISAFGAHPFENTTSKMFYVKKYQNWNDPKCPSGWFEITGKCLKLFCWRKNWQSAQDVCSNKDFAVLAYLNEISLPLVVEYLEQIQVRVVGFTTISVGLTRTGQQWWKDGRTDNTSLGSWPSKPRLVWDKITAKWKIEESDSFINDLHLCEKRANVALRSLTNQSSTKSNHSSDLAVDSLTSSCSATQLTSQTSWWQVTLAHKTKIYLIKLLPSSKQKEAVILYVSTGLFNNISLPTCEQTVTDLRNRAITVICEPPKDAHYVKLVTKQRSLELCEVEVYGTESLRDLIGVSRAFWSEIKGSDLKELTKNKNYPLYPDWYHIISSFDPPKNVADDYGQVLEAFFMPRQSGNYIFFVTAGGDVEFYISRNRQTHPSPVLDIVEQTSGLLAYEWHLYPGKQKSSPQFLNACQFYLLKVLTKEGYGLDHVSLGIQHPNGSSEKPMTGKNLFWILPGKLEVERSLNKSTVKDVIIDQPLLIAGTYITRCLGIYCGECPLAIFLTFAGYYKCILVSTPTAAQNGGSLSLALKPWFASSGFYDIVMGYEINGNCLAFITSTKGFKIGANRNPLVMEKVLVKPISLATCQFNTPKFCASGNHVDDIRTRNDGWRRIQPNSDDEPYSIRGIVNKTASFSFKWIGNKIMAKVDICVKFRYKISGVNNSLLLFIQTFSEKTQDIWSLQGYHGDQWHTASIKFKLNEKLMFVFKGHVAHPNTTVAIADVNVTTADICSAGITPPYAKPGYECHYFYCANGQCIHPMLRCNGLVDCLDKSDEVCPCSTEQFRCKHSGRCISNREFCDGVKHCDDGSDEENCYSECTHEKYYCPSGKCLSWSSTCNGKWDCMDGADEPDICDLARGETINNTTCSLNNLGCSTQNNTICVNADCDFEEGFCAWRQLRLTRDNFDWSIKTSFSNIKPHVDHTTCSHTGKYIFIEASFPRKPGDLAILETGPFEGGKNICITFYYHIRDRDIGSLDIYKVSLNKSELLWTGNDSKNSPTWQKGWFNVESNSDYNIIIQATCGTSKSGNIIAIDDISMIYKNCSGSGVDYDSSPFCSFIDTARLTCGWETKNKTWRRRLVYGRKLPMLQGFYIETRKSTYLSTSVRENLAETYQCISFWFKYYVCPGMLFSFSQSGEGSKLHFLKLSHTLNEEWRFAEILLQRSLKEYTVTLNVTIIPLGVSSKCYLGIGEINFSVEPCLGFQQETSEDNSVLCPKGWESFRSSCYQFNNRGSNWTDAKRLCATQKGATLVTLNDVHEEQFVKILLKRKASQNFWIVLSDAKYRNWISGVSPVADSTSFVKVTDKGWDISSPSEKASAVCEYKLAPGSCDFEANWCGWQAKNLIKNESHWDRKFIQRNNISEGKSLWLKSQKSKVSKKVVNIYVFKNRRKIDSVINFVAGGRNDFSKFTLCLWLYPYNNNTEATVIKYGKEQGLRIYFKNNAKFMIDMEEWNTITNASVSFETWQHICLTIDTTNSVWTFYKDGLLTDIGVSNVLQVSKTIVLGSELGKITKPNMWSRRLNTHEVAMFSTGCGVVFSGDVYLYIDNDRFQNLSTSVKTITVSYGECVPGKGLRLTYLKDNLSSSDSTSSLVSPWMKSSHGVISRKVCLTFVYRLLGQSEMKLSVEPKHKEEEMLWKVKNTEKSALWRQGQVFLGFFSEFRVHISATLMAKNSEVNIDNILFKEEFCNSIPTHAQDWKTYIDNSSSGFLTSPYYPSYYMHNIKREWEIKIPVGQKIKLKFLFLNLEKYSCKYDYIVFQYGVTSQQVKTYCGDILPPEMILESNTVKIIFKTDGYYVRTGFKIHYELIDAKFHENKCDSSARVSDCPQNIRCSYINSNKTNVILFAQDLYFIPSYVPEGVSGIQLDGNYLTKLAANYFKNLTDLEYLSLRRNQIDVIEKETFYDLRSLKTLCLAQNYIKEIPNGLFNGTCSLKVLDLGMNAITKLQSWLFVCANNTRVLSFRHNKLESLDYGVFSGLSNLQYLYLDANRLSRMDSEVFKGLRALKVLILKNNKLKVVKASWFRGMTYLHTLDLHKNSLREIEPGAFSDLKYLAKLDLSKNHIQNIPECLFCSLESLEFLKVDHFTLCCYAKQSRPSVSCLSVNQNGFSSCDELLKNKVLKYSIWLLGVMAFAGNLVVIVWRIIAKDRNQVNSFLLTNLAVADFLMGVYMLIIAYKDTVWQGVYFKHDISWRASDLCIFAGVVSSISSEVSVFTLSVITLDRLICVVFPFRFRRLTIKKATTIMFLVWLLGSALALAPLFNKDYFYDYDRRVHFFGRSAVCLPLQLSSDRPAGWEYSVSIFIFLNGLAFLFILLAYIIMYRSVIKSAKAVRSTRMNQDSTLAKRMMFIILTDFFCWFPVIVISILSLTGNLHDPRKEVYAWIAVFVLPINSSINPLLYTFSTPFVRKNICPAKKSFLASFTITRSRQRDGPVEGQSSSHVRNSMIMRKAFTADEEITESSFIEKTATIKHCVKILENVEMFDSEEIIKKSFIALCLNQKEETLCFVDVYENEDEKLWRNTTKILSCLSLNGDHDNILSFLWSARASEVSVKNQKLSETSKIELESNGCLICYELPSKQTLQDFLDKNDSHLTEDVVYAIIKGLIQAIEYLSSKEIAHNAICPCNIIITESLQVITALLGGFSSASFVTSSNEDSDEEQDTNDVESFGNILRILLETFPASELHSMLHEIMVSCLSQDRESRPTSSELCELIESMDIDQIARDVIL